MRVSLFVTCLVDQVWPSVGTSAVEVLRRAGCDVDFDPRQTCCGQPAFNTGYRPDARQLAERFIETFEKSGAEAIVAPSGSCTAMIHHYADLFDDHGWRERAEAVAARGMQVRAIPAASAATAGSPEPPADPPARSRAAVAALRTPPGSVEQGPARQRTA